MSRTFSIETVGDTSRVSIDGQLLWSNRQELKQLILDNLEKDPRPRAFVIDLAGCPYIDSAGLGVLVSISRRIRDAGSDLVIENPNEDLGTLFQLTKLDTVFTIRPVGAVA